MTDTTTGAGIRKIALVGRFLPRPAAGALPATLLYNAFSSEFCDCESLWVAVSDEIGKYAYPSRVRFEVAQFDAEAYRSAADFLNLNNVDLVCYNHHFDPFPDPSETKLPFLSLLEGLRAPLVSSLRAVPPEPNPSARQTIAALARFSVCLIVSSATERDALRQEYAVPDDRIQVLEPPETDPIPGPDAEAWRFLARQYMACFEQARQESIRRAVEGIGQPQAVQESGEPLVPVTGAAPGPHNHALPMLKLDHFLSMTDGTGILNSAVLSLPDFQQGYNTSNNARALMFCMMLEQVGEGPFIPVDMQMTRHLAFLYNAFNAAQGRFRETMDYSRTWRDETGSEECHGLAIWALGMVLGRSKNAGVQGVALHLFDAALPAVMQFSSLRVWAFALMGIHEYLRRYSGDRSARRKGRMLLDRLVHRYHETASKDWPWFEESLDVGSACIAQALIASQAWASEGQAVSLGLRTLSWLAEVQFQGDRFAPIGDYGCRRGRQPSQERVRSVQRPIEARSMISASLDAYRATGDERWLNYARDAFQWFLGRNDLGQPLYDSETGGCCNGLLPGRLDRNYGAEALLSFLLAQLEMRLFDQVYHQRRASSPQLPILQIGSPSQVIRPEASHLFGLE